LPDFTNVPADATLPNQTEKLADELATFGKQSENGTSPSGFLIIATSRKTGRVYNPNLRLCFLTENGTKN
jgi:hypothetical protein